MKQMSDKTRKIIFWTMLGCSTILLIVALVIIVGLKESNSSLTFLMLCSLLVNVINIFVFEANAKKSRKSDKEEKDDKEEPKE